MKKLSKRDKVVAGAMGVIALVALSNFNQDSDATVTETTVKRTTTTTSPAVTPTQSKEDLFLEMVHENVPFTGMSDGELLNLAYEICSFLDDGNTTADVLELAAQVAVENNLSDSEIEDLGSVLGYAVGAFCPEYNF